MTAERQAASPRSGAPTPWVCRSAFCTKTEAADLLVQHQPVRFVHLRAAGAVATQVGQQRPEQFVDGPLRVTGGADDGVGDQRSLGVLLGVLDTQLDPAAGAFGRPHGDARGEDRVRPTAALGAAVELVVDLSQRFGADALVELALLGQQPVSYGLGQPVEVARVVA